MQSSSRVLDDMVWCTIRAPVESPLPTISAALALLRDMKRSSFLGCSVSGSRSAVGRAPGRVSAHHGSPTSASPSSNITSYSSGIITQSTGTKVLEGGSRLDLGEPRKEGNKELAERNTPLGSSAGRATSASGVSDVDKQLAEMTKQAFP